jgi:hypothetical protein
MMDCRVKPGNDTAEIQARAFSSEVGTGSREENASIQNRRASLLIPSEARL